MQEQFAKYQEEISKLLTGDRELTSEEKKLIRIQDEIQQHLDKSDRTIFDEYILISNKESKLPVRCREHIINIFK